VTVPVCIYDHLK